jgi:ABC-type glycerol-3-phosphate transport system substrate-binding protein
MSKHNWVGKGLTVAMAGMLILTGCAKSGGNAQGSGSASTPAASGAPSANGKITINFIDPFTGGDGGFMTQITDGFNKSQDKYFVKEIHDKDHYTKFKSGNYDLVVIRANDLQTYKQDGMIQDVSSIMDKAGLKETDFHPAGVNLTKLDGKMYSVPLDIHPLSMFYNKQLTPQAPATYDDLVKLQATLQAKDKNLYALGVPATGLVEFYTMTIAAQNGIELKKDNYLNFAQPELADALLTFNKMVFKDKLSPAGLGLDGEFQSFMKSAKDANASVQTAVSMTGPWYYSAVKEKYGDQLGVASVPKLGAKQAVYGNSHTIAVSAKVKDQKVLDGISEYMKYVYTPQNLIHWAESGQAPVHKATMDLVAQNKDKFPISYANMQQFDSFVKAPSVYQFGEQIRYMNETVFAKVVSTPNITKDQIMKELETATKKAQQIAATEPKK